MSNKLSNKVVRRREVDAALRELYAPPRAERVRVGPRAMLRGLRAGRAFTRGDLVAASAHLARLEGPWRPLVPSDRMLATLRAADWRLLVVSRLFNGPRKCLFESIVRCAGLRACGYPAQVVVGHMATPLAEGQAGLDDVHAWVSVDTLVLNPEVVPGVYVEVARYPDVSACSEGSDAA